MSKKSLRRNYIYNVFYQVLTLLAPLITTPYISRVLGADGVGTASFIESVVSYFTLFATMGITIYGQREISYAQNSRSNRSEVFWNTKFLEFVTAGTALALYLLFAMFRNERTIYFAYSFLIVSVLLDVTWLFQGMEEFGKIVVRNTMIKILNIAYIFIVVRSKEDLILYAIGIALFPAIGNLSLWPELHKVVDAPDWKSIHPFQNIRIVWSLFIPTIAIQVYTVLDKTMIGVITADAFQNGYYEQASKLAKSALVIVTSLGTVMIPRIGFYYNDGRTEEVKKLMYKSYRFVWAMGIPLCIGLMLVAENFVPWFYGVGYDEVGHLLGILSLLIIAIGISNVTGLQYFVPTKRQHYLTQSVVIGAATNLVLNLVMIPRFGATGAAVASVIAETTVTLVQIYYVRSELSGIRILKESVHYVIAGIIMGMTLSWSAGKLSPSVIHTVLLVTIGTVVYVIALLGLRDQFAKEILQRVFKH